MSSLRYLTTSEINSILAGVKLDKLNIKNTVRARGKVYKLTKGDITKLKKEFDKRISTSKNLPRYLTEKEINYLVGDLPAPPSCISSIMEFNRNKIIENLKFDLRTFKISPSTKSLKRMKDKIQETYFRTLCRPGDAVGSHGAMSLGQALTQANLDVFHVAGSANSKEEEQRKLDQLFSPNTKKAISSTIIHLKDKYLTKEEVELYNKKKFKGINIKELIINTEIMKKIEPEDKDWYNNYMSIYNKDFPTENNFMRLTVNTNRCYTYGISTSDIADIIEKTTRIQNNKKSVNCIASPTNLGYIDIHVNVEFMRNALNDFSTKGQGLPGCQKNQARTFTDETGTKSRKYIKSVLDLNTNLEELIIVFLNQVLEPCFTEMNISGIKGIENIIVEEHKLLTYLKFKKVTSDKDLNTYSSRPYNIDPVDFFRLYYVYIDFKALRLTGIPGEKFIKYIELCGAQLLQNNLEDDIRPNCVFMFPKVPDVKVSESDVENIKNELEPDEKNKELKEKYRRSKELVGKNRFIEKDDYVYDLLEEKQVVTVEEPTELISRKFRDSKKELDEFIEKEDLSSVSKLDFPEIYRHGSYSFIKVYGKNILREILKEKSVDPYFTSSNNVKEVSIYYGIEAARLFFVKEYTSNKEIKKMNPVNIELLVDFQTNSGQIHAVTSTDIAKHGKSALVSASFEQPLEAFKKSATMGTTDIINNVPSCIMTGKKNNNGSGIVNLFYDDDYLRDPNNKFRETNLKENQGSMSLKDDKGSCFGAGDYTKLNDSDFDVAEQKALRSTEEVDTMENELGDIPDIQISNIDYEDQSVSDI